MNDDESIKFAVKLITHNCTTYTIHQVITKTTGKWHSVRSVEHAAVFLTEYHPFAKKWLHDRQQ